MNCNIQDFASGNPFYAIIMLIGHKNKRQDNRIQALNMLLQTFVAQKLLLIIIAKHTLSTIKNPRNFII
jgi:hypothetical protein